MKVCVQQKDKEVQGVIQVGLDCLAPRAIGERDEVLICHRPWQWEGSVGG